MNEARGDRARNRNVQRATRRRILLHAELISVEMASGAQRLMRD